MRVDEDIAPAKSTDFTGHLVYEFNIDMENTAVYASRLNREN